MSKLIIAAVIALLLLACNMTEAVPTVSFVTDTPPVPTATITPTPPANARFPIGTKVYLKSDTFAVSLTDDPRALDADERSAQTCYTNYLPTVLSIVRKDGVTYYLLDCGGIAKGWLPEDKIDSEPGR